MTTLLLAIIYIAFISLGLPDSMLGAAWPTMGPALHAQLSWAGGLSMTISAGTIISALISERVTLRFGAGKVTAISTLISAAALLGFSMAPNYWVLLAIALPYGLGAGAIDAALNNYVAVHYQSSHMNWLHSMWGLGALIGPYVMGYAISSGRGWATGYHIIGFMQLAIAMLLLFSLPLWKKVHEQYTHATVQQALKEHHETLESGETGESGKSGKTPVERQSAEQSGLTRQTIESGNERKPLGIRGVFKLRGAVQMLLMFFCYCAFEQTCMLWASSYLHLDTGVADAAAASMASLFLIGITVGRIGSGFLALRLSDAAMIRIGQLIMGIGVVLLIMPAIGTWTDITAFILIGLGCAPMYPCIIHLTPTLFGARNSQAIVGMQMAFAYLGSMFMPALFGVIAQYCSMSLLPWYLLVLLLINVTMHMWLHRLYVPANVQ
ncbi:MFS transporter [Bifidobacterium dolichotidis]|uniref:MFS transporter n=1 Tax=Bifidobacterium dolichotidis TaxID=2306976 RepID=A0A430FSC4_9BIFI|nr:MFS transporter [Bifidobacterium dolichotidis]RSX55784.1 MFS transporter [Bifidobacterium dolichotidis]